MPTSKESLEFEFVSANLSPSGSLEFTVRGIDGDLWKFDGIRPLQLHEGGVCYAKFELDGSFAAGGKFNLLAVSMVDLPTVGLP